MSYSLSRASLLGFELHFSSLAGVTESLISLAADKKSGYVCISNTHQLVCAHEDHQVFLALNNSVYNFPDSQVLRFFSGLSGRGGKTEAFRGYDLLVALCTAAERLGLSVGFYGGRNEVIYAICENLSLMLPKLHVAYAFSPPFESISDDILSVHYNDINLSGASILFVGLGCPKQERWMYNARDKVSPLMVGVGAAFDFLAGFNKPSPSWVHKSGLEWLYRLFIEPKRLWRRYLKYNSKFLFYFFKGR